MKYRELRRKLREHGIQEDVRRGKGSHRIFWTGDLFYPIPYHGDNENVRVRYIRGLERLFNIELL